MSGWSGPPREIVDEPLPSSFREFCQLINQKDHKLPADILQTASDVFNKLHGLKQIEKNHLKDIWFDIETIQQDNLAKNHVYKLNKKVDEAALKNLELIVKIIEHYKK